MKIPCLIPCLKYSSYHYIIWDDYRELIELFILFLVGDFDRCELKIRLKGSMHSARLLARAIYSLKISLLSTQFKLIKRDKANTAKRMLVNFDILCYPWYPWMWHISAAKAPYLDPCFLKSMKAFENVYKIISKAALKIYKEKHLVLGIGTFHQMKNLAAYCMLCLLIN